jgi:natural product precursor
MKPLVFNKKLQLNKNTVVNLNNGEMKNAYGGYYTDIAAVRKTVIPPPVPVSCICSEQYTNCASEGESDPCCICPIY